MKATVGAAAALATAGLACTRQDEPEATGRPAAATTGPAGSRPNVVLLITHDTGRHISPYGIKTVHTPNCEKLAGQGVLFKNSFCTGPLCSPSRAAIVTGRYPHSNGVMGLVHGDFGWEMHDDEKPAAKLFGAAGYATWLLAGQHESPDSKKLGFDVIDDNHHLLDLPKHLQPVLEGRDRGKPFFCQVGGFETHRGWETFGTQPDDSLGVHVPPYLNDGPLTRVELAQFQGMVRRFDQGLGMLMELLEAQGVADNTIFVVTTDHGIAMPRAKSTLYDPGIETMLMIRWPGGKWTGGRQCEELISNIDILPTLLEACGISIPSSIQGRSFAGLLNSASYQPNEQVFAEKTFHDWYDPIRCIRTGRYKYVCYFEKNGLYETPSDIHHMGSDIELAQRYTTRPAEELFDLQQDPRETRNLVKKPEHAALLGQMRQRLGTWMKQTNDPLLKGPVASPFYYRATKRMAAGEPS